MKIKKAVITAAGKDQRGLPPQRLVDSDGVAKSALRIVVEEAEAAGADQIAVVINPGDQPAYVEAAGPTRSTIQFIAQPEPLGYGHALWRARDFVGDEPFLHLVGDHLCVSEVEKRCAQQLMAVAEAEDCAVSAVQSTRENLLPYYGTVGGHRVAQRRQLYEIETVIEKPTPTVAEQHLIVPGLRAGHYLCFFGMHVLTPVIFDLLGEAVKAAGTTGGVQLSPSLARLAARERYLAFEVRGLRYNLGLKHGLLVAQMALALNGQDREDVLAQLLELLARRKHA